ncbi:MAG: hypothetical protein Ta2F_09400 [Termitinemataceae bacterium]|nr:MAG: hypothetical protein Ta2F_09400 [Termitinemataceae bacterium]
METLSREPLESIWGSCETRAETKAIYHLLANSKFNEDEVKRCLRDATIKRISENGKKILAVQDTTGIKIPAERQCIFVSQNTTCFCVICSYFFFF